MAVYLGNIQVSPLMSFDYWNDEPWVRPENWPNLDNIYMPEDFEGVYMTFENFDSALCRKAGLNLSTNTVIDVGYLNEHDEFEPLIPQIAVTAAGYKIVDYSAISTIDYPYVIIRVLPATTSAHIASCRFGRLNPADTGGIVKTEYYCNDCVERRGRLPYCTSVTRDGTDCGWVTTKMQKDATVIGTKTAITGINFSHAYFLGNNLREIDFTGWDTSNWTITSLASVFYHCYNLKYLDLRSWDTTKWDITSLDSCFYQCLNLRMIYGIENWDTSGWVCTTIASAWYYCRELDNLNICNWDTTNWKITSLASTWAYCFCLKKLDLSNWNTSNWKVTTTGFNNVWNCCYSLEELKIGTWDVSDWTITALDTTWASCRSLKNWEASQWHTPAWNIKTLNQTFRYCTLLKEINFSNWDCSEWALTTIAGLTSECFSLVKLDMSNIDVSTIVTANNYGATSSTGLNTILYCCRSLEVFNPPTGWNGHIYLHACYNLPRAEIVKFFNNLVDRSNTTAMALYIHEKRHELTSADIAIATAKNYTIS